MRARVRALTRQGQGGDQRKATGGRATRGGVEGRKRAKRRREAENAKKMGGREEGGGGKGASRVGAAPPPQTFDDHDDADDGEKPESDPVVPIGNDVAEIGPETPSQHGKEQGEGAEWGGDLQAIEERRPPECYARDDGGGEGVHRKSKRHEKEGRETHRFRRSYAAPALILPPASPRSGGAIWRPGGAAATWRHHRPRRP